MTEAIITTLITGTVSLIGTVIAVIVSYNKTNNKIQLQQVVMSTKLETLTEEVKRHNEFITKVPILEEKIKMSNHKIKDIEQQLRGVS